MNRVTFLITLVAISLFVTAIAFGEVDDRDYVVQRNRSQVTEGIYPPASCPPTPDMEGNARYLWEDFESTTFPPTGWDTLNYNEGWGWFSGTYSGGGTQAAMVTWDQDDPVTLQDEWLITPELDVSGANSQLRVEFYMLQGYDYPHDFKVHVTVDGGANWSEVFDSYGTGYPEFQYYFVSVSLNAYAGSAAPIRIGFQYYGTDADIFALDNVEVTDDDMPAGRCCVYTDPFDPLCYDEQTQAECAALGGTWSEGLDCTSNPCPTLGLQLEPDDDLYTDPDEGGGHSHPVDQATLWVANYDGSGHHQRINLKWDLSEYAGQEADSAFINLYRYFRCPGDYYTECELFTATEDWIEETWNEYVHLSHGSTAFLYYTFGPALDWYRLDITSVVNQWLEGTLDNYGVIVQAVSGQKWSKFYSKEGTYPPYLELYGLSANEGCCEGQTGDANCSGEYEPDIADITRIIDYLYLSHDSLCCPEEADVNVSGGEPDISDITRLIDYLYLSHDPLELCP